MAPTRLLVAASGTGGHLFPALAVAEQLSDWEIEWLGVPNRLETKLVPACYPLRTVPVEGLQSRSPLRLLRALGLLGLSTLQVWRLLRDRRVDIVFTTGGYIAAPAIVAARQLRIPALLHESNAIPGRVTRWLGPQCQTVALGFADAAKRLPRCQTVWTSTPVRERFRSPQPLALPVPENAPLIAVVGGSQGAVAVNRLVRACAPAWFAAGATVVHLTGERDPDAGTMKHPQYVELPFYDNVAGLFQRADLAVSRAGAGTLTELAFTRTPSVLIPFPFAADDHQAYNAAAFASAGAAVVLSQANLERDHLQTAVLELLGDRERRAAMAARAASLAVPESAEQLAALVRAAVER
ncbi:undecaprenyldiphospho-muramoylpentapeptidebeta-N -acetylglucosaminyltransferase [Rubidibacter lacunae KORDI 51-2]|uniref:UDP-N-acetylglucosamine--N-acetylmuramyl-(pentapeptide) pyrophosphoryl-undecaprenol N-acetylglucosamine transferase n=1 Tax=Rubidibacter lacunae KORDI 51-2 TaxID=582515 RepID=U5DBR9_9CHRO|nr:undecaprenyldiphospho-muramoylpentapeptide beta-N-acetylglucosaminyltransferase [Rubidibacter lacunae]ERN41978.1 undecaprenyldiphospho-muramoylpentapeptidebeta-N -acetylglucosaminyltransferase [Rubidibacter lacunae KORDI 51-2]